MGRLLSDTVARVTFSVDAGSEGLYAQIRRGGDFSTLRATIEALLRERRTRGLEERISIFTAYTLMRNNLADFKKHVDLFTGMGVDAVEVGCLQNYTAIKYLSKNEKEALNYEKNMAENNDELNNIIKEADLIAQKNGKFLILTSSFSRKEPPANCWWPYKFAFIDTDGFVYPCCNSQKTIGSLRDNAFREIWNGGPYRALRRELAENRRPQFCENTDCNFSGDGHD